VGGGAIGKTGKTEKTERNETIEKIENAYLTHGPFEASAGARLAVVVSAACDSEGEARQLADKLARAGVFFHLFEMFFFPFSCGLFPAVCLQIFFPNVR
jgi:hypothetical protein